VECGLCDADAGCGEGGEVVEEAREVGVGSGNDGKD
jgi:hypothetical protein